MTPDPALGSSTSVTILKASTPGVVFTYLNPTFNLEKSYCALTNTLIDVSPPGAVRFNPACV